MTGIALIGVLAAAPGGSPATNSAVWGDFSDNNVTGWVDGFAFLIGVLNGAFTIGTPDAVTHLAEELPHPSKQLPFAIGAQIVIGTITSFGVAVALGYGIQDLNAIVTSTGTFPAGVAIQRASGSDACAVVFLVMFAVIILNCTIGTYVSISRTWWSLARDQATPFSRLFSMVNTRLSCPIPSMVFLLVITLGVGAIQLGSKIAFQQLISSFIILTLTSYGLAIFANMLGGRRRLPKGWFSMPEPIGWIVSGTTLALIVFFVVIFTFPYALPVDDPSLMQYTYVRARGHLTTRSSVVLVGVVVLTSLWYLIHAHIRGVYKGPAVMHSSVMGSDRSYFD